jgi:NADPH:quinone reductase-like Zn-dependent oxidoreductase
MNTPRSPGAAETVAAWRAGLLDRLIDDVLKPVIGEPFMDLGRAADLIIKVAGSCRASARADAKAFGVSPIFDFDFDAANLKGRFDLVFDTAGTLSSKTARTLMKPGGDIIDIVGTPAKMLRSVLPGPYRMQFTKGNVQDLETVSEAVARGQVELRIARTVPLTGAIQALTELETRNTPKGGKLVITTQ